MLQLSQEEHSALQGIISLDLCAFVAALVRLVLVVISVVSPARGMDPGAKMWAAQFRR